MDMVRKRLRGHSSYLWSTASIKLLNKLLAEKLWPPNKVNLLYKQFFSIINVKGLKGGELTHLYRAVLRML